MPYYILTVLNKGNKFYFSEGGWTRNKSDAVWFTDRQQVEKTVSNEGLKMSEVITEEGWY